MEPAERYALNAAMARLADGDRSAFLPVFQALWPLLASFATRLSGSPADAEDAAQTALLRVFERAARYDPAKDAAAWALAITANECHAARRKERRTKELDVDAERVPARDKDPESSAIDRDLLAAASEVLGTLRPEDAATLVSAWRGERSAVPGATFRKRVQRASERLRAAWRSRHGA
jgi:RNA polymerase sigma-70 factor (ECF subfamily)